MKKFLALLLIVVFILALAVHIPLSIAPLNRIILDRLGQRLNVNIDCRSLKLYLWRSFVAEGVEATGKGGFRLKAENVVIDYDPISLVTGRLHVKCSLEDVMFFEEGSILDAIFSMLDIKPMHGAAFSSISGDFYIGKSDIITRDLAFLSNDFKIYGNGVTDSDTNIMCLLRFFLRDDLADEIPEGIRDTFLKKEEGPWSSLYVGVMGNYKKPVLRIMTDWLRLNIASK